MGKALNMAVLERYLDGTATMEEIQQVEDWLHENDGDEPLFKDEQSPDAIILREEAKTMLLNRLELPDEPVTRTHVRRLTYLRRAAAAITVGLLITSLLWYFQDKRTQTSPQKNKILADNPYADNEKAWLYLSDNRRIALDAVPVNAVVADGNTRITKTASDEIVYTATDERKNSFHKISVPKAAHYKVVLADGSKVWVNAMSTIRFPVGVVAARQVTITGEAYFEVAKQMIAGKRQPFTVQAGAVKVEVLGTHFNVNAYEDESGIKTTLLEGSVHVKVNNENRRIRPGEQASVNAAGKLKVTQPDLELVMAWQKGYLQFNDASIVEVFRQVSRWYDVEIEADGATDQGTFHVKIHRGMKLSAILSGLKANGARFHTVGKKIFIE
ncbi:FecR family protein [Chitinophaga jiangningensis]|uniref:FecR family protein n=1 Tax=Chitinophaga jiangningensis TaxID=1419482 RepID=A0A1M7CKZ1_9BACT|nr:FecR domain-containing protein [Chitinophaga jiangningensis]SHL67914.1 FecR family protein [Chitinophaga jiangningensis]